MKMFSVQIVGVKEQYIVLANKVCAFHLFDLISNDSFQSPLGGPLLN